jgi:predicted AlkP superfamily phosphohydrolase/phosphomutase
MADARLGSFRAGMPQTKKVVVLGIDGMDHALTSQFLAQDKLPNLARLQRRGCFKKLATTIPAISPVAWSSFQTGTNPGKHNIFDFVTRDKGTYLPRLSSVDLRTAGAQGEATIRLLRKSKPFWSVLADHRIFSNVIRVPITFPPEPFDGVQLSGMCVPDMRGTQGAFSFYTTRLCEGQTIMAGERFLVKRNADTVEATLTAPPSPFQRNRPRLQCRFTLTIHDDRALTLRVNGTAYPLTVGVYSPWIPLEFSDDSGLKARGIARFLVLSVTPEFQLYVTPINIDPVEPAVPISHPPIYASSLAKRQGLFGTLGQSEDTWALNEGILTDELFIQQCLDTTCERERMFLDSLDELERGLCVCVFDGLDRIQHAFWRDIDEEHPARGEHYPRQGRNAIEDLYRHMDALVGKVLDRCPDEDTVLMVISDHGFTTFRYGVDLNRWLEENGYLKLRHRGRFRRGLIGIDWSETRAFSIGLTGIFLNLQGRESRGVVESNGQADGLRREIADRLAGLTDPERGNRRVVRRVHLACDVYRGPYKDEAPDLIVGFEKGYRVAWANAMGQVTDKVFHENARVWSGDHCVDSSLVPGVLFCNRDVATDDPSLIDIAPTILDLFGLEIPKYMDGAPLTWSADLAADRL